MRMDKKTGKPKPSPVKEGSKCCSILARCTKPGDTFERTQQQHTHPPTHKHAGKLQDLEGLFQLDHQRPVGFKQIITEVVLARVDTLTGDLQWEGGEKRKRVCDKNDWISWNAAIPHVHRLCSQKTKQHLYRFAPDTDPEQTWEQMSFGASRERMHDRMQSVHRDGMLQLRSCLLASLTMELVHWFITLAKDISLRNGLQPKSEPHITEWPVPHLPFSKTVHDAPASCSEISFHSESIIFNHRAVRI